MNIFSKYLNKINSYLSIAQTWFNNKCVEIYVWIFTQLNELQELIAVWIEKKFPAQVIVASGNPTLYDIIKQYGNVSLTTYYPIGTTQVDAYIAPVPANRIQPIANLIMSSAAKYGLNSTFLAACIMQESCYCEACFNNNLSASNLKPSFNSTDWGICQMSGTYLPDKDGMRGLTTVEIQSKSLTADWAIPMMAEVMQDNFYQATIDIRTDSQLASAVRILNTTTLSDVCFLSTLYYNRGQLGSQEYIKTNNTAMIKHPYHVGDYFAAFNKILNGS